MICVLIEEQNQDHHYRYTHRYIDIRHIKDREIDNGKINEINHIGMNDPVDHITERPGAEEQKAQTQRNIDLRQGKTPAVHDATDQNGAGEQDEDPLPVLKHSERRSAVFQILEIKYAADDRYPVNRLQVNVCKIFCDLIEQDRYDKYEACPNTVS